MNKPAQCRSDTCKTHAADESLLGSLETDYEVKGQIRKRLECTKKAFTFDAMVKRKLPQFQWGVSCWHWESIYNQADNKRLEANKDVAITRVTIVRAKKQKIPKTLKTASSHN